MTLDFDIIVVGSGVGGSSVASHACERGLRVLIIDNGEDVQPNSVQEVDVSFIVNGKSNLIKIPSVNGAGGNSLIYGGHLTRYPAHYWRDSSDSHIPIDYETISHYYDELISKFNIAPIALNKSEADVRSAFVECGFGSDEIVWAVSNYRDCNGCGGIFCQRKCKKDFFSVLCAPLISQKKLLHWSNSTIVDITSTKDNSSILRIKRLDKEFSLSAKCVVFSCGAFGTPAEIIRLFGDRLDSKSIDQVGRRMMFHISDFFILFPKFFIFRKLRAKLLCSSENLFKLDGKQFHFSIQSVGAEISGSTIYRFINRRYAYIINKTKFFKKLLLIFSYFLAVPLSRAHIIASIVEDPSLSDNYQDFNSRPITIKYQLESKFAQAILEINKIILRKLRANFFILKFGGELNLNFGHAMGGMSMGIAQHCPVDKNCKVKGLENIYVCDASVLPYSAATNPSLTIAALGCHVAESIFMLIKNEA